MDFKFFTAEEALRLEAESQFDTEIRKISKKIQEEVNRGSYVVQLPHNKYSEDVFREFRKAGFLVDSDSPCGIIINWKHAVDKENESAYAVSAYLYKVNTDNVLSRLLQEIESGIRTRIKQYPGTGSFARKGKGRLSREAAKIIEANGFKVTHYDSTVNREEYDLIEWPVG